MNWWEFFAGVVLGGAGVALLFGLTLRRANREVRSALELVRQARQQADEINRALKAIR